MRSILDIHEEHNRLVAEHLRAEGRNPASGDHADCAFKRESVDRLPEIDHAWQEGRDKGEFYYAHLNWISRDDWNQQFAFSSDETKARISQRWEVMIKRYREEHPTWEGPTEALLPMTWWRNNAQNF
jgi:hypothetical protein